MDRSHKTSFRKPVAESPTAVGYITAIVGVIGAAFLLPPFPLLFVGVIALAFLALVVFLCILIFQCLLYITRKRPILEVGQMYRRESSQADTYQADTYSHAPVAANHAGIVSDR